MNKYFIGIMIVFTVVLTLFGYFHINENINKILTYEQNILKHYE
jgi:hypothetical protein